MTRSLVDAPLLRLTVPATPDTGLRTTSQVQINRILTLPVAKVGQTVRRLNDQQLVELNRLLAVVNGLT